MLKNKRSLFIFTPIIILIILIVLFFNDKKSSYYNKINIDAVIKELNITKIDSSSIHKSINLGGDYLSRIIEYDGQFKYRSNLDTSQRIKPKYNTLRHAGAIYALCMYYEFSHNPKALNAAIQAAGFMKDSLMATLIKHPELIGIWSHGNINHDNDPSVIKLGGNGLGLLALAYLEKIKPGTTNVYILQKMGDFILFMQKKNGGFYSKYFSDQRGRDDSWTSLYYPGEAVLGLLMLYEIDSDIKWLNAAAKALKYLAKLRKSEPVVAADHWALIATTKLLKHYNDLEMDIPAKLFIDHGIQISKSIIKAVPQFPSDSPYYGCMTSDGRTTPTATRLEGLLSFINVIPEQRKSLINSILITTNRGIGFLEKAQIKNGSFAGGMTRALTIPSVDKINYGIGPDYKRDTEIRIDYVQHALCAWIQYYEMVYD